ncbi:hypothetical protein OAF50_02655 [bacterium]|nr:hypothetical protein [bacterium]
MGIFRKLFSKLTGGGFRWSCFFIKGDETVYSMHEHSVLRLVAPIMGHYHKGQIPQSPWMILLQFNKCKDPMQSWIMLSPDHFKKEGETVSELLTQEIAKIDPGWMVAGGDPVIVEVATKKQIPLYDESHMQAIKSGNSLKYYSDLVRNFDSNKPKERTFHGILSEIFN